MMRRNCNLELSLLSPSFDHQSYHPQQSKIMKEDVINGSPKKEEQELDQKKLTIFYNGRVAACDVTDLEARSIIQLASQEKSEEEEEEKVGWASPIIYKENNGLSMKRSLQQFLQKRRKRIQSTSPYHHHHHISQ